MIEELGSVFEELVEDFAEALDAWSQKVKDALNGRPQKVLVNGLRNANPSNVSRWLSGREQIWKGQAALPGVGLTQDIVQLLQLHGSETALLMQLAERVDQLQKQLMEHKGWRKKASDYLQRGTSAETSAGSVVAAAPGSRRRKWRRQPLWRDQPTWVKATSLGGALAVVVASAVIVTAAVSPDGHDGEGNGADDAAPQPSPSASMGTPQGGPGAVPSESPGLEKGTLGEDSRCSAPFAGPGAVAWRVCARVEAERVSFALKITNSGSAATTVKIRLEYAQASKFHPCPKAPSTHLLDVAAGKTVITHSGQCAVPREATPIAYQGVGWVIAEDANAGSYKLAPTAHVYPDHVIWQPDLV
ncbi:hypothetical protein [Streptomyces mirabilis]|uniref:hypothetical protein n=1 Tax=Streptomyces mirabilis TaxID=68239 RepID=UPI00382DB31A